MGSAWVGQRWGYGAPRFCSNLRQHQTDDTHCVQICILVRLQISLPAGENGKILGPEYQGLREIHGHGPTTDKTD